MSIHEIFISFRKLKRSSRSLKRSPKGHPERKRESRFSRNSLIFQGWTSLGLNQGPPDYESVKVGFFKISQNIFLFSIWLFIRYLLTLQPKRATLRNLEKLPLVFAWCSHGVRMVFADLATDLKKGVTDYGN